MTTHSQTLDAIPIVSQLVDALGTVLDHDSRHAKLVRVNASVSRKIPGWGPLTKLLVRTIRRHR